MATPVQSLELAIRGCINERLREDFGRLWFSDPAIFVTERQKHRIRKAKIEVMGTNSRVTNDRVVRRLPFGFWVLVLDAVTGT